MKIDDICDCLEQALEFYRENADLEIQEGVYKVSFNVRLNENRRTAEVSNVSINPVIRLGE